MPKRKSPPMTVTSRKYSKSCIESYDVRTHEYAEHLCEYAHGGDTAIDVLQRIKAKSDSHKMQVLTELLAEKQYDTILYAIHINEMSCNEQLLSKTGLPKFYDDHTACPTCCKVLIPPTRTICTDCRIIGVSRPFNAFETLGKIILSHPRFVHQTENTVLPDNPDVDEGLYTEPGRFLFAKVLRRLRKEGRVPLPKTVISIVEAPTALPEVERLPITSVTEPIPMNFYTDGDRFSASELDDLLDILG